MVEQKVPSSVKMSVFMNFIVLFFLKLETFFNCRNFFNRFTGVNTLLSVKITYNIMIYYNKMTDLWIRLQQADGDRFQDRF